MSALNATEKANLYATRIANESDALDRALAEVIARAKEARAALRTGNRMSGLIGFDPLGHAPGKVAIYAARLGALIEAAGFTDATDEQVLAAYTVKED